VAKGAVPVVERLPLAKGRTNLGAMVERVRLSKRYVILEKDGVPVAGVMSQAEFRTGKSRPAWAFLAELRKQQPGRQKPRRKA
jgi:hypothetical protein